MRPGRALFSLLLASSIAAAIGCLYAAPEATPATTTASRPAFTPAFAAIAYYDASCRRCHGPQGSFYGPQLGKNLTDAQLIKVIKAMAEGPGQSPLDDAQLAAETAYHRAIIVGEPFVSITALTDHTLTGEAMPEATVKLTIAGQTITAKVDETTWSASLPANAKLDDLLITATLNGKKTTLKLPAAFTHTSPLPATQPAR